MKHKKPRKLMRDKRQVIIVAGTRITFRTDDEFFMKVNAIKEKIK